ncbi:Rix1p [Saccharomyces cerevisiae x Saccharomyces kudriavzevii VIN7]|uniref:Pre-rRNA-processing protein RIX1 n=1 Tax=Saccharomyces cerevisiae x Saccharomyces kudriavzevii (strain VIN7) TaxID=1095631 RepID=H0GW18_SACCK|nr:Rix1p [Saccharomyces cerevisiae x Saccharomyces kudriavzevii VIN7]
MSEEFIAASTLAKSLEFAQGNDFHAILTTLRSPAYINEQLLKSELGFLVTKILKLLRSSNDFDLWKGCHTSVVVCAYNPLILSSHGGQLLAAIYSKLEQKTSFYSSVISSSHGKELFNTLVSSMAIIIDLTKNKPTLSREALVPKLKAIIPTLITLSQYEPKLVLPVLQKFLKRNNTTFKPFINKFRTVLTNLIISDYASLDSKTQKSVCENFAYLHLLKIQVSNTNDDETQAHHKVYPDANWRTGLLSILSQFKPIIQLCEEILDFEQDNELQKLIAALPVNAESHNETEFLPRMKLDFNAPLSLWEIPQRLSLLVDMLVAFISLPTPFPIRVPLGGINSLCEVLLGVSNKYLPLKKELRRDNELNGVINNILPQIQFQGIKLWEIIVSKYGKCGLSLFEGILSSIELFIPLKKKSNNEIDFNIVGSLKSEFFAVFRLINMIMSHLGHQLSTVSVISQLIDVALFLSRDKTLIDSLFKNRKSNTKQQGKTKQSKKTKNNEGAFSDIYTHPELFVFKNSMSWFNEINEFLITALNNWILPSTPHIQILKYSITQSLRLKEKFGYIPETFVDLLRCEVLHPGNERVSILPIAISLLKGSNDDMFELLCHPKVPVGMVYQLHKPLDSGEEEEERGSTSESETITNGSYSHASTDLKTFRALENLENVSIPGPERAVPKLDDEAAVFKKRTVEEITGKESGSINKKVKVMEETIVEGAKESTTEVIVTQTETEARSIEDSEDEEDDEFEIPAIELSDEEGGDEKEE